MTGYKMVIDQYCFDIIKSKLNKYLEYYLASDEKYIICNTVKLFLNNFICGKDLFAFVSKNEINCFITFK